MPYDNNWGSKEDEDSKTRPGEKDFTGHEGDDSKTDPGKKDYSKEEMADYLANEARDGPHLLEILEEEGWELTGPGGKVEAEGEETMEDLLPMPPGPRAPNHMAVIRIKAARDNFPKEKGKES